MIERFVAALLAATALLAAAPAHAGLPTLCDRHHDLSADDQDVLLRFGAVVKDELAAAGAEAALVARTGTDLHRFGIRYSHAGVVLKDHADLPWSVRQLYFACDERRPRVFDQGVAGFVFGSDDPATGWVSLVFLPPARTAALARAAADRTQALRVLGSTYSANAYPFSTRYQNCNQWVAEILAAAWDDAPAPEGEDPRRRAQGWLYGQRYAPTVFEAPVRAWLWAAELVPLLHSDDHPPWELADDRMSVSMPLSIETFVHRVEPAATRVELCHVGRRVVVHRGWDALADGCVAGPDDRTLELEHG